MRRRGSVADSSTDRPDCSRMSPQRPKKATKRAWRWLNGGGNRDCHFHALDKTASPQPPSPLRTTDLGSMPGSEPSRRPTACAMGKPAVLHLHLHFPPHHRSTNRREGRVHSPLQAVARPPTRPPPTVPATQPADLPTFPPTCVTEGP